MNKLKVIFLSFVFNLIFLSFSFSEIVKKIQITGRQANVDWRGVLLKVNRFMTVLRKALILGVLNNFLLLI